LFSFASSSSKRCFLATLLVVALGDSVSFLFLFGVAFFFFFAASSSSSSSMFPVDFFFETVFFLFYLSGAVFSIGFFKLANTSDVVRSGVDSCDITGDISVVPPTVIRVGVGVEGVDEFWLPDVEITCVIPGDNLVVSLEVCVLPRNAFIGAFTGVIAGFIAIALALGEFGDPVKGDELVSVFFSGEAVDVSVASVFFFFLNLI
jgi:hypothetical protein